MKRPSFLHALPFLASLMALPALAQSTTQPAAAVHSSPLITVQLQKASLEDVIEALRAQTHANILLKREGGRPSSGPAITSLNLKDVTLDQVLQILCADTKNITYRAIPPEDTTPNGMPIYVVTVTPPRSLFREGENNDADEVSVQVYSLAPLLQPIQGDGDAAVAERANDLLQLMQSAVGLADGATPVFQYHPPTQTVIVKATGSQQKIIQDTIKTLSDAGILNLHQTAAPNVESTTAPSTKK